MIIDSIENLNLYFNLNPHLKEVFDYINKNDLTQVPDGIVNINSKKVFANFCTVNGKSKEDAVVETHDKMMDIQIPLSSTETMGYIPRAKLPNVEYNKDNDISFYSEKPEQYVDVHPGMFVIFLPQDGHAPCISTEKTLKKVIFKVEII